MLPGVINWAVMSENAPFTVSDAVEQGLLIGAKC